MNVAALPLPDQVAYLEAENADLKQRLGLSRRLLVEEALARRWRLTWSECHLLMVLHSAPNRQATHEGLHYALYGDDPTGGPELKIITVFICKIRKKIRDRGGEDPIETIWGRGFRLSPFGVAICDTAARSAG